MTITPTIALIEDRKIAAGHSAPAAKNFSGEKMSAPASLLGLTFREIRQLQ
jgi:hypothetical protein